MLDTARGAGLLQAKSRGVGEEFDGFGEDRAGKTRESGGG